MNRFLYSLRMMKRTIRLGAANVKVHKMRSALTVLGIVFGVCSVISMLSIGEGASREVQAQIRRLGSQNIIIKSVKPPENPNVEQSRNFVSDYGLKYSDAERIDETMPSISVVLPVKARSEEVRNGGRKATVQLLATVPWFIRNHPIDLKRGRFFTPLDMQRLQNVCVLGERAARDLFPVSDALGQAIDIGGDVYRVIGIAGQPKAAANAGSGGSPAGDLASQQADCFVPISTVRARNGDFIIRRQQGSMSAEMVELNELILVIKELDDVMPTSRLVEAMLAKYHPRKDYQVIVPMQLLEEARKTQRIFSIVLGSIAAISLLVGGIGIMNIMLATVSERTREIGVRRALGARQRDIMAQFLVETLILSVGGGILGMILGVFIPWLVTRLSGMPTVLTLPAFLISFLVSAAVGLVFGLYPARRAAMMDPIDALRHE